MPMNIDSYLGLHANAIKVRSHKANLIAENLANADTPGFKARDIDFRNALNQVSHQTFTNTSTTHAAHIGIADPNIKPLEQYRAPLQPSLDGNTVETDVEQSQFTDNAIRYQASLSFLNKKITGLVRVLRGE